LQNHGGEAVFGLLLLFFFAWAGVLIWRPTFGIPSGAWKNTAWAYSPRS
jgi:hypothetical protein